MIIRIILWAVAHLLANGRLGDITLFGSFLIWAVFYYMINRRRERTFAMSNNVAKPAANAGATAITIVAGTVIWAGFAFWAHRWLIGVSPFAL